MDKLFRLNGAERYKTEVDEWLSGEPNTLFSIARHWFTEIRKCGDDVQELIHDGCPVACVEDAAFAYVNVFSSHVNVGFFTGAMLNDPSELLEGSGKRMRHVKLRPDTEINTDALSRLINEAYLDIKSRLKSSL